MQTANHQLAAERETNRSLGDTRELLFRELQHRVSNNLQVAAGLLTMQNRYRCAEDQNHVPGQRSSERRILFDGPRCQQHCPANQVRTGERTGRLPDQIALDRGAAFPCYDR